MNAEAFDTEALLPPATLPDALVAATFAPPAQLIKGNQPGEIVILIEAETFSGT